MMQPAAARCGSMEGAHLTPSNPLKILTPAPLFFTALGRLVYGSRFVSSGVPTKESQPTEPIRAPRRQ
jgi:hypothetical protein